MEFKEQLPVWKAEGVAPPETIQNEGWKVGDRPPADIFNWLHNRTYTSLEEIREKMNWLADNSGKVETVNNVKPDSNKNIKLTGTNIAYKDGVTENIATKIDNMDTELDTKADNNDLSRSSTIVIANYDSHENSKNSADVIIEQGENAAVKINQAIQSLEGIGGEIKLMEGKYNLEYGLAVNIDGVHLTGIPGATVLVQSDTWKGNPNIDNRLHVVDTWREDNRESISVAISGITIDGKSVDSSRGFHCYGKSIVTNCASNNSGGDGFWCGDTSQITNCTSNNSGKYGFWCSGTSQITNCTSNNSGEDGFWCVDTSQITNCTSNNSGENGFYCVDTPQITNCTSNNSGRNGFYCDDTSQITNCTSNNSGKYGFWCSSWFKGVCSFNVLKGDELSDASLESAKVEYNIVQEV